MLKKNNRNRIVISKLIQTCETSTFSQWDAWTIKGKKLYISYKYGLLLVTHICNTWPDCDCDDSVKNNSCEDEIFSKLLDDQEKNGYLSEGSLILILADAGIKVKLSYGNYNWEFSDTR